MPSTLFGGRTLCVTLTPELLSAVVRSGRRIVAHSEIRLGDSGADGACAALQTYLSRAGVTLRGMPVTLVLSTRWCQLAMLPWSDAQMYDAGAQRYRQAHFTALYGEAEREILCEEAPYGQARLACAVERTFLERLRGIARDSGHPCLIVESMLSAACAAIAPERYQAVALIEPGQLVLATLAQGRISDVRQQPLREPWHAALPPAWQHWVLRPPELGEVAQVALFSLGEQAVATGLAPPPFADEPPSVQSSTMK